MEDENLISWFNGTLNLNEEIDWFVNKCNGVNELNEKRKKLMNTEGILGYHKEGM